MGKENCKRCGSRELVTDKLCQGCLDDAPYSLEDYEIAKKQGLDLDDWRDYEKFYELGTDDPDDWWRS